MLEPNGSGKADIDYLLDQDADQKGWDDRLNLPLLLASGGVPCDSGWLFFTLHGSVEVEFDSALLHDLLARLDGRSNGFQAIAAVSAQHSLNEVEAGRLAELLDTLVSLRVVVPTPRLYETYYAFCDVWPEGLQPGREDVPVFGDVAAELDSETASALPRLAPLLEERGSCRIFAQAPVDGRRLVSLLWAAYGNTARSVTGSIGTVPSPGGLYPIDVLVAVLIPDVELQSGLYRWEPRAGTLQSQAQDAPPFDPHSILAGLPLSLQAARPAALMFLVGKVRRVSRKYGSRSLKFLWLEAGHCMQNAQLAAVELRLGMVQIGGYDLSRLHQLLRLSDERLYLTAAMIGEAAQAHVS